MDADGKIVGENWKLLTIVGGSLAGTFMFVRGLMAAFDSRSEEKIKLFFSNGGGEMLGGIVKSAVLEALQEHQVECPHARRVGDLTERVVSLERR